MKNKQSSPCSNWDNFPAPELNFNNCKKEEIVISLFEYRRDEKKQRELETLAKDCQQCSHTLEKLNQEREKVEAFIPYPWVSAQVQETLKLEIAEMVEQTLRAKKTLKKEPHGLLQRMKLKLFALMT